jgi:hypothetical protein
MNLNPKKEYQNVGFHYTVTNEQIRAHQQKSVEEIISWLEETAKFIYEVQTPEERERLKKRKTLNGN